MSDLRRNLEETQAAAGTELLGLSPIPTLNVKLKCRSHGALHAANLGGVTTNTVLAAQADLREGFMKERTGPGRWDVQGTSRHAQIQTLGKVDLDVDHG